VIGLLMLVIGVMYFRGDVTTSAKYYDSVGMQPVMNYETFYQMVQWLIGRTTLSPESWAFGIGLSVLQIYFGYMMAVTINLRSGKSVKDKILTYFSNPYTILRLLTAVVDTYTDVDFRSYGLMETRLIIKTLVVSIFVYNLGSEYAITAGFRESIENVETFVRTIAKLLTTAIIVVRDFVTDLRSGIVTKTAFDASDDFYQRPANKQNKR